MEALDLSRSASTPSRSRLGNGPPLQNWIFAKCHKGWTWQSGKPPPTRPVAGGNQGMNFPLSELVSWVVEPEANVMVGSGEPVSGEDLKSKVNVINVKIQVGAS